MRDDNMPELGAALVTGASSGIGLHLTRELVRHGHPVYAVAPVSEEIQQVATALAGEYGVPVTPVVADLTHADSAQRIFAGLAQAGVTIDLLVNNAGLGQGGRFWEYDLERDLTMTRLNVEATVRLTKAFLPGMISRQRGRILNLASVAAFEPGPREAVYHATKAFVLSFSEALATELDGTGVTVTALCPGPTDTDFFDKAGLHNAKIVQKGSVMAPQDVAAQGYEALMAGERVRITGAVNKLMVFARHLMPESAQAAKNEKLLEDAPPEDRTHRRGDEELAAERKRA